MKNIVRIIPPVSSSGLPLTQGTKVFVGDTEITGIVRLELTADPNSVWEAKITLHAQPHEGRYLPRFYLRPFKRWWHKLFPPKEVELTDLQDVVRRFGRSDG